MDKQYLLTYRIKGNFRYEWFDTEDELREFVDETEIDEIQEALYIKGVDEIDLGEKNTK